MDRVCDKILCNPTVKLEKGISYPLIDMEKIQVGKKFVSEYELIPYTGQSCSKFCDGDTIMARITPCLENGKIAQYKSKHGKALGSTELFVFREIHDVSDNDYIFYLMSSDFMRNNAANSMTGASGRQRADMKFISKTKWNFPDIFSQRKIGSILSAYDDLIEKNNRKIAILQEQAQEIYKEWFVRFRFPGHETVKFENGLPEGWTYDMVENLSCVLRRGISPVYDENGESLVINQKCIRESIMDISESRRQSKAFCTDLNLQDGDTVICSTGTGTLGRVGQVFGKQNNTTFDSHVTLVRAKPEVGSEFLYFALKNMQIWFMNMGIGSTNQQELYRSTIKNAKVILPDITTRERFNQIVYPIHKCIANFSREITRLRKQRDLLLPRLMSGKLEV